MKVIGMLDIDVSETLFIEKTLNEKISGIVLSMWKVLIEKKETCSQRLIYTQHGTNVQQFIMHSARI